MSDRAFRLAPSDIDLAFQRNEFHVVFQPKVDLASERMTGAEVFVRWQHPQYGLLPPGLFLDFVESAGRMPDLTGFVFHAAMDGAKRWKEQGKDWAVSINVSTGTATSEAFPAGLAELLNQYGLEPERVIVEAPERAIAQDPEKLCAALLQVRELGVHVALDGGGIVPVDLSQLSPLPFTSVKVGGPASIRLAQRLGLKGKGAVAGRLRFAHEHGLEAVAVGAEDEATMAGLADVGFTAAQGMWIQKPLSLDELLKWNGNWARGRLLEPLKVADKPAKPAAAPAADALPTEASKPAAEPAKPQMMRTGLGAGQLSKEDMQRALEAVRAKRAQVQPPVLQPKAAERPLPVMPALEADDLEDVVEDEEASAPAVKQQGFGAPLEPCPPMKELVERRSAKASPAPRNDE